MNTGSIEVSRLGYLGAALLLVVGSACGPAEGAFELEAGDETGELAEELRGANGLSLNGLSLNGLSLNGLSLNGLSLEGLSSAEFDTWFQENPELHNQVMKYVVRCAVPAGVTRTYTSASTGMTRTWKGNLGLAPDWTNGAPATVAEQQIVSACLAAHADKYGVHTRISVLGRGATGEAIPYTSEELQRFSEREACFFGNLFTDEGVFVGNDGRPLNNRESTTRACALSSRRNDDNQECLPIVRVERDCARFCTLDASRKFYVSCTYNGVEYPVITTRLRPADIYTCGDDVCQLTESCGTGHTPDNCGVDCGRCQ
ncbi:hypothetical protein [Vitiosangium sp. GDMCC 1.1324]|uniref:hypothetical protein n=1 Tax=Vitiosangium sp. (strain GDMCC 1.1324) TaxID=2138576 RepID=UPI000D339572|nr:hypothetical protein [Vitiosangium sp. GDMCC 1.1324]PTL85340.1 hypothetical protein DAT35_01045 [Vitiosangium sp. GDMCC 1.1324]